MRFVLPIGMLLALWGCSSSVPTLKKAEYYFERGQTALEKKRCLKAIEEFQRVVTNFPGSSMVPHAQYYLAEAHYCNKDYVQAVFEYERLLNTYPSSEWVDDAQFRIAEAYYNQLRRVELDQQETYESLTHFRRFIDDNPSSPLVEVARERIVECRTLLAEKRYLAAQLYHKQKRLEAAAITYRDILRDFPDTPYYYETLAQLGKIAHKRDNPKEARIYWVEVQRDCEDEKLVTQVEKLLSQLEEPQED
jgi:outer membrane protein assembly factor BamD